MYSGELQRITFEFSGPSLEAVLDRIPTAEIISDKDGVYKICAEVYGNGIQMCSKLKEIGLKISIYR